MGIQRFLIDSANECKSATVSASSTAGAANAIFPEVPLRADASTGTVELSGTYTDTTDATFQVVIVDSSGTTPKTTTPVFTGAGNGTMTSVSADAGTSTQTVTVTLKDLGTADKKAAYDVFGVRFECRRAGVGSNTLTWDSVPAYTTADIGVTLEAASKGDTRMVGDAWAFQAAELNETGELPAVGGTDGVIFGESNDVYRIHHAVENQESVYYINPPLVRDVPAGTTVKVAQVSLITAVLKTTASAWAASTAYSKGTWIVDSNKVFECTTAGTSAGSSPTFNTTELGDTTTDNTVTWTYVFANDSETFTNLRTIYDLHVALTGAKFVQPASDAVIKQDNKPGGTAQLIMPLKTEPYIKNITGAGTTHVTDNFAFDASDVSALTASETYTLTCKDNDVLGSEVWTVKGSIAGEQTNEATTAEAYSSDDGKLTFTIPRKLPTEGTPVEASAQGPQITASSFTRQDGTNTDYPIPAITRYRYGALATNKTFTFTWQRRGVFDSDDNASDFNDLAVGSDGPDGNLLGVEVNDDTMALTDTAFQVRQSTLNEWYTDFLESNTVLSETARAITAHYDIELARLAHNEFISALRDIFTDTTAVTDDDLNQFQASTAYSLNDEIADGSGNGDVFRVTTAGTTAGSEPAWNTSSFGDTTTSNTVVFTYVRRAPLPLWDTYEGNLETLFNNLNQVDETESQWEPSTPYNIGHAVIPTTPNGRLYRVVSVNAGIIAYQGTSGASEPSWPTTLGSTVTDNELVWMVDANLTGVDIQAVKGATTSGTGSEQKPGRSYLLEEFSKRFAAQMREVRVAAGLSPGKSSPTPGIVEPSLAWVDRESETHWFTVNDGDYLPMFLNDTRGWYSAQYSTNQETGVREIVSTKELWLAVPIINASQLAEGDSFTVTVSDVQANRTYVPGDIVNVPIVVPGNLAFTNGITGDNTHTWGVYASAAGALADYTVVHGSEADYNTSGLHFIITRGSEANSLGDQWLFEITQDRFKWRKNSDPYSSNTDIPASGTIALSDGISATFSPANEIAYDANDTFQWTVKQPNDPQHSQAADWERWKWSGATADITYDFGSDKSVDAIAILWHGLPSGAGITLELLDAVDATVYSATPAWDAGVILDIPSTAQTARKLKISLTSATDGWIAWAWAGTAGSVTIDAEQCLINRTRAMSRAAGTNAGATHLGTGYTAVLTWTNASGTTGGMTRADLDYLDSVFAEAKSGGDLPICLVPNVNHTNRGYLLRWADDDLQPEDLWQYGLSAEADQEHAVTISFDPVYV